MPTDTELPWRRIALCLAREQGQAAVPTHFQTVPASKEAAAKALASAMFAIDDANRFRYPEDALSEARLQLDPNPPRPSTLTPQEGEQTDE